MPYTINDEIEELRTHSLDNEAIANELLNKGYSEENVNEVLYQDDEQENQYSDYNQYEEPQQEDNNEDNPQQGSYSNETLPQSNYDFTWINDIVDGMIDEKWDELIEEVKKIVDWKEKIETKEKQLEGDIFNLQEKFSTLNHWVSAEMSEYNLNIKKTKQLLSDSKRLCQEAIPIAIEEISSFRGGR